MRAATVGVEARGTIGVHRNGRTQLSRNTKTRASKDAGRTVNIGPAALVVAAVAVMAVLATAFYLWRAPTGTTEGTTSSTVGSAAVGVSRPTVGVAQAPAVQPGVQPATGAADAGPGAPPATGTGQLDAGLTPAGNPYLGSPTAPVQIVVYSDYQCPNCRQFATEVLPWLKSSWLGRGFVRVEYRDFAIRGEPSFRAAEAAHCAGEQGAYWSYHDALFAAGPAGDEPFARATLDSIAAASGLDTAAFASCLDSGRHRARVEASTAEATRRGFEGTPAYDINGRVTMGAIPVDRWNELFVAYEAELGG